MSTTTIERTGTVRFMARCPNQVLTRRKTRYITNELGERTVLTEEEWQERQRELNEARIRRGEEPVEIDLSPWKVEFNKGIFETDDPVLIDFLRKHPLSGFNGPSGFWEFQPPVDEREPTVTEQLREVQRASMDRDLERAEVCLEVEQETHNRPVVLKAAEEAVVALRELDAGSVPDADSQDGDPLSTPQP